MGGCIETAREDRGPCFLKLCLTGLWGLVWKSCEMDGEGIESQDENSLGVRQEYR